MRIFVCFIVAAWAASFGFAEDGDGVLGTWTVQNGDARVEIARAPGGALEGKIIWLREPVYEAGDAEAGQIKHDRSNPDPARRSDGLMGLTILHGFRYTANDVWKDGTIYDPKSGDTYRCKLTLKGDILNVRGFIGISLLGRTETWNRVR